MATILFFYGEDTYRSREKLRNLKQRYIDASLGDTNLAVLDGASLSFEDFSRQVQAMPFLAKTRLVVVENFLFAGRKEVQEKVSGELNKIPDSTVVVFWEGGLPDKRSRLFRALNQPRGAQVFEFLKGHELENWVAVETKARSLSLAPEVTRLLIEMVGSNLWRMDQELAKLAAYQAGGGRLDQPADLDGLLFEDIPSDIFAFLEKVARGDGPGALADLERLLRQGLAEPYLIAMLAYQFRTLILLTEGKEGGFSSTGSLARELKLSPFVVEKGLRLLADRPISRLIDAYQQLLEADLAIKTGELPPRLALELLIVALCQGD